MPGVFSKDARPVRPGAYFDWAATPAETIQPNIGSVVALGIVHDWGPAETPVACSSLADFQAKFGPSQHARLHGGQAVLQGRGARWARRRRAGARLPAQRHRRPGSAR